MRRQHGPTVAPCVVCVPVFGSAQGQRNYASLGALLSHAIACWAVHVELAQSETMRGYLGQRDLYARLTLKTVRVPCPCAPCACCTRSTGNNCARVGSGTFTPRGCLRAGHPLGAQHLGMQQQQDLLAWAEAHTVLAFLAKDRLLERFAAHAPASWRALRRLGDAATHASTGLPPPPPLPVCP